MNLTDIQRNARAAIRDANQSTRAGAATGPTSAEGKGVSAMNATRHGVFAKQAVMPGEDVDEYVRGAEEILISLGAKSEPEAELALLVHDDIQKAKRLDRIERGLILGRVEELMAQTDAGERAKKTANALRLLGTAIMGLERDPIPAERGPELDRRLHSMQEGVSVVSETLDDAPLDIVAVCHRHLTALLGKRAHPELPRASLAALDAAARQLMGWLIARGERDEAVQADLRKAVAGIALPAEAELKKLARYMKMVEESLARRIAALEALRRVTADVTPATEEQAKAFRLRLRVVT